MNSASTLHIPGTPSTPEIRADWSEGTLYLKGDSYPENTFEIFDQVIGWVERYLAEAPNPLRLELHLIYLNTSSVRAMIDILDLLEAAHGRGRAVSVQWYYDHRNQRVAELAEEFKEDYTFAFDILTLSP